MPRIVESHVVPGSQFPISRDPSPRDPPFPLSLSKRNPERPVLLYDTVTLQPGAEQEFRSEAFKNNLNAPLEFHSLRMLVTFTDADPLSSNQIACAGVIALSIDIDGKTVTIGTVPIWNLARSDNRNAEQSDDFGMLTWYFASPFPLLPGQKITVQAKHLGISTETATVRVGFAGRVSQSEIARRIPFAAAWTSQNFGAVAGSEAIPPNALVNATKRDLHVSRIIGRSIAYSQVAPASAEMKDFDDRTLQGVTSLLVRLGISQTHPILKTFTPWRAVFGTNAAIETDFILKPGDYLSGDVQHLANPAAPVLDFSQNRGSISIVGWREE